MFSQSRQGTGLDLVPLRLQKGLVIVENPGIQMRQNPAAPRNSHRLLFVWGYGKKMITFFLCPSFSFLLGEEETKVLDLFLADLCLLPCDSVSQV